MSGKKCSTNVACRIAAKDSCFPVVLDLHGRDSLLRFQASVNSAVEFGCRKFIVMLKNESLRIPTCACVAIAGVIDYYKTTCGCSFSFGEPLSKTTFLSKARVFEPMTFDQRFMLSGHYSDCVWKIDSNTDYRVISGMAEAVRRMSFVDVSVVHGVELALNEAVTNVWDHSVAPGSKEQPCAFVMICRRSREQDSFDYGYEYQSYVEVAVFDYGRGLHRSVENAGLCGGKPVEAIKAALNQGVSEDKTHGAGNGLWMLDRITSSTLGLLEVSTAGCAYRKDNSWGRTKTKILPATVSPLPDGRGTTLVRFMVACDKHINIAKAFNCEESVDLWVEQREIGPSELRLMVKDDSNGTGTRKAAREFFWLLSNIMGSHQRVTLDFKGVTVMSNAYARTLFDLLYEQHGADAVKEGIRFENMAREVELAIFQAVVQGRKTHFKLMRATGGQ